MSGRSLSGSGAIATEIIDHDDKLKPVSVMGGSDHFSGKEEMEAVLSREAEVSTLKESSEGARQLGLLSDDGKDASSDCHMKIKPMVVDQDVLIQDNSNSASHIEQAASAEANIEGPGARAEAAPIVKNQEMEVETVKFGEVGG